MTRTIAFPGLMMHRPLLLKEFAERAETVFAGQEVVGYRGGRRVTRTLAETVERARRLASSLSRLGIGVGDRVATFGWNTLEHLELYIAVPAMGAVLHPVNIRVHEDDIRYIIRHAGDRIVFVDDSLSARLPRVEGVEHEVVMGGGSRDGALDYEELIAAGDPSFVFPEIPEDSAAAMCYTSGTTGAPKCVVYSHRSTVLHTLLQSLPDLYGLRESDVILPVVPMFHANAWGLPYAALMVGARLVLPGENLAPEDVARTIAAERVTFAAAVTTIWHGVAQLADLPDLSSLREVVAGGAPVGEALLRRLDELGVPVIQGFGMTEVNPLLSVGRPPARLEAGSAEWTSARLSQGRPMPLVGVRVDESVGGELMLAGNTVASAYYDAPEQSAERFTGDGWMRTGDIVTVDGDGLLRLLDRTKDLVKSGGEWISSVELENAIMSHPGVLEATVVAAPDERWGERPCAFVVPRAGAGLTAEALREHLAGRVAKWWIPELVEFVPEIAKTSVGKFDKKVLRVRAERLTGGRD
ncbi:long-chain fatty acid--CoA ligase [Acrocarpospora catenulata]|uniref:long-chain fatty acid--CoA ligase n=1 Tax=Acrocarpospora catenulata TaxID=2836182 RepID=UPI002023A076|nr:long-chain fatty acid--CoA ligase [Acrocarpospora catenulata]